ncbi:hypothetical protein [uncultured Marinobacter sp.]|uniref:hypothetical protein n=1 Tax=uncultured Marinobacter sp. TaxID=187379 RepID=UPI0030DC9296
MKRTKAELLSFKVQQAVGSMAIEDIQISRQSQAMVLRVASGRIAAQSVKDELIEKYRQSPSAT